MRPRYRGNCELENNYISVKYAESQLIRSPNCPYQKARPSIVEIETPPSEDLIITNAELLRYDIYIDTLCEPVELEYDKEKGTASSIYMTHIYVDYRDGQIMGIDPELELDPIQSLNDFFSVRMELYILTEENLSEGTVSKQFKFIEPRNPDTPVQLQKEAVHTLRLSEETCSNIVG